MKRNNGILVLFLMSFTNSFAQSPEKMDCSLEKELKYQCKAPYIVSCANRNYLGYIKSDQKISSVKIRVILNDGSEKTVKFDNTSGPISEYFQGKSSDVLMGKLQSAGLSKDKIRDIKFEQFSMPKNEKLYKDSNGLTPAEWNAQKPEKPVIKPENTFETTTYCEWISEPNVIEAKASCGSQTLCVGRGICRKNGKQFESDIGCKSYSDGGIKGYELDGCPTATECANDEGVRLRDTKWVKAKKDLWNGSGTPPKETTSGGTQ